MNNEDERKAQNEIDQETVERSEGNDINGDEVKTVLENDFLSTIIKCNKKKEDKDLEQKNKMKEGVILLTKKEKERLKKEAEKEKKKKQNLLKKEQQTLKKNQIKEINKQNSNAAEIIKSNKIEKESKIQDGKMNLKPVRGNRKGVIGLSELKKHLEMKKKLEEEEMRLKEEEERVFLENEQIREKELAAAEAKKLAKKQREKEKKEALKAEGKFLTKKQKEEKRLQEQRLQLLLNTQSIQKTNHLNLKNNDKKKRVVYTKKSKNKTITEVSDSNNTTQVISPELNDFDECIDNWENINYDSDSNLDKNLDDILKLTFCETELTSNIPSLATEADKIKKVFENDTKNVSNVVSASISDNEVKKKNSTVVNELRSPICCILGHVDVGKTKLLDKIRKSNVQGGEAGGITQQIGATFFPIDVLKKKMVVMNSYESHNFEVSGLLIIDTPGHESFSNLRSRGSSLCNIAILVVDLMHGLEQQTNESLRLLRDRKAPFVIALNKIDRLYGWKDYPDNSFRDSFTKQSKSVKIEFQNRLDKLKLSLSEQGLNSELYYENKNMSKYVSIIPTSAITGEGIPDLLWLILDLTHKRMSKQLMYLSKVEATILEVKLVEGFGYTIDVILSNGILREDDKIVLCGTNGPIVTHIRALLTPPPSSELRIKSEYNHNKVVKAAIGVKIAASNLEKAVAGSRLIVINQGDDIEKAKDMVIEDFTSLLDYIDSSGKGVIVQASTLGSLEALLEFLKSMKIPVMSIGLGPVYKREVLKATTMLEKAPEFAILLCFDVKIDKEAEQYAQEKNIKIFNADIIYHLFDSFTEYQNTLLEERRKKNQLDAVFPCVLQTVKVINKRNPMIIGVDIIDGSIRIGTPICVVRVDPKIKQHNVFVLGRVTSLELNHKSLDFVKKGETSGGVAMKLENSSTMQPVWGRHVFETDKLYSLITKKSIETLKDPAFLNLVKKEEWLLIKKLKLVFNIK